MHGKWWIIVEPSHTLLVIPVNGPVNKAIQLHIVAPWIKSFRFSYAESSVWVINTNRAKSFVINGCLSLSLSLRLRSKKSDSYANERSAPIVNILNPSVYFKYFRVHWDFFSPTYSLRSTSLGKYFVEITCNRNWWTYSFTPSSLHVCTRTCIYI